MTTILSPAEAEQKAAQSAPVHAAIQAVADHCMNSSGNTFSMRVTWPDWVIPHIKKAATDAGWKIFDYGIARHPNHGNPKAHWNPDYDECVSHYEKNKGTRLITISPANPSTFETKP